MTILEIHRIQEIQRNLDIRTEMKHSGTIPAIPLMRHVASAIHLAERTFQIYSEGSRVESTICKLLRVLNPKEGDGAGIHFRL